MAISEDCKYIVSGSDDGEIQVWGFSSGEVNGPPLRGTERHVFAVSVSRKRELILSGHALGTVYHWDVSGRGNVPEEHSSLALLDEMPCISCVTLSANGKLAVSGSEDNVVQKWNTSTVQAVGPPMERAGRSVAI